MTERLDDAIASVAGLHNGARLSRTGLCDLLADDVEWWVAGPADVIGWRRGGRSATDDGDPAVGGTVRWPDVDRW